MPQILLIFADSSLSYIPSPVKKYNNLGLDETWKVTKCKKASKVTIACSTNGDIIGGWALDSEQSRIGFTRVMYPFFAGLLLFRASRLIEVKNAFLLCSLLLIIVFSIPRLGGQAHLWLNGLYDSAVVIFIFPLIVFLGASGKTESGLVFKVCKFFGDISYPIYITHYPIIYIYTGWVATHKVGLINALPIGLVVFVSCILLAYICLRFYDIPVRNWLKNKVLK